MGEGKRPDAPTGTQTQSDTNTATITSSGIFQGAGGWGNSRAQESILPVLYRTARAELVGSRSQEQTTKNCLPELSSFCCMRVLKWTVEVYLCLFIRQSDRKRRLKLSHLPQRGGVQATSGSWSSRKVAGCH